MDDHPREDEGAHSTTFWANGQKFLPGLVIHSIGLALIAFTIWLATLGMGLAKDHGAEPWDWVTRHSIECLLGVISVLLVGILAQLRR
jgi:hypothetical protein